MRLINLNFTLYAFDRPNLYTVCVLIDLTFTLYAFDKPNLYTVCV